MILTLGFFSFRYFPTPLMVPPVPTPQTKWVTLPSLSSKSRGPSCGSELRIAGIVVLIR